mmetsp:Transcript_33060/g.28971  ORF Transcript_33060/g.28971 Transcript_33060/m.28971 type:complete len:257 (+) Transcript_33060:24-794(+)
MGCCLGGNTKDESKQGLLADVQMDEDEKEQKSDQPLTNKPKKTDDELPEMSVNRLATASVSTVSSPRGANRSNKIEIGGRRVNAAKPSPLNSFPKSQQNPQAGQQSGGGLYGPPTTAALSQQNANNISKANNDNNGINNNNNILDNSILPEEDEVVVDNNLIDNKGDVHANRYYNETRNANLSITSKYSDLSNKPINPAGIGSKSSVGSNTTLATNLVSNVTDESLPGRKSNASALLWDDFSDKGTSYNENNTAQV